jgi:TetR/AcrR family transcriptional regulator, regulator of mycofactocin system
MARADFSMTKSLKTRKQELVRDTIFDAAMELFASKGFNETTVDEIVEAAGISQRSFFRYFPTKSDVLAYEIDGAGDVIVSAVEACPRDQPGLDAVRRAVQANVQFALMRPRTRQIIEIASKNISARRAHRAARGEVEDRISEAFAARTKGSDKFSIEPRMLTFLTLMAVDLSIACWFMGEAKDSEAAMKAVFTRLTRSFCENGAPVVELAKTKQGKPSRVKSGR